MIDSIKVKKGNAYSAELTNINTPLSVEKVKEIQKNIHEQNINSFDEKIDSVAKYLDLDPEIIKRFYGGWANIVTPETKPFSQFALTHEGAHIYHRDTYRFLAANGIIPVIMHIFCKKMGVEINFKLSGFSLFQRLTEKRLFALGQAFGRSCFGLPLKFVTTIGAMAAYKQTREYAADRQTIKRIQDPHVLQTTAQVFEALDDYHNANLKKKFGQKKWIFKYPWLSSFFADPVHPPAKKRAEYLRKAAQKLEKNNNKK